MPKFQVCKFPPPSPVATASALVGGLLAFAAVAEPMTSAALKQSIPGAIINLDTPLGSVVPITYAADGTIEGKAGAVAFYLGSERDRGRWWIESNSVCHQWNVWFDGKKKCLSVNLKQGNRVEWSDQDGGTGTATVVAFGKAEPEAPKQVASLLPSQALSTLSPSATPPPTTRLGGEPSEPRQRTEAPKSTAKLASPPPGPAKRDVARPPSTIEVTAAPQQPSSPTPPPRAATADAASASPAFRVINVAQDDVLNVRRGPGPSTDVVGTIDPDSQAVRVTGLCNGDWCPVQSARTSGWVHRYFIAPLGTSQPSAPRSGVNPITYRVVGVQSPDVLNVRRVADGDSEIVATIPSRGNRIRLTGYCRREWCPVSYGRATGWVNRQYLTLEY